MFGSPIFFRMIEPTSFLIKVPAPINGLVGASGINRIPDQIDLTQYIELCVAC